MDHPESSNLQQPVTAGPSSDTHKDAVPEQRHEQLQPRDDEILHHDKRDETAYAASKTPENIIVAAGMTVDVRAPPEVTASHHASRRKPGAHMEQPQSKEQQPHSIEPRENESGQVSTLPASTVTNAATSAGDDSTSPYRAVYPREDIPNGRGPGGAATVGQGVEQEQNAFQETLNTLRGLASRARESFSRVSQGGFADFRRARDSIHRVGTGDFSDLAAIERYLGGILDECAAFSEKLCPCASPEVPLDTAERASGPPRITMLVDTPGGPYLRMIPDSLIEESVQQGLLSAADVERQRQETLYSAVPPIT